MTRFVQWFRVYLPVLGLLGLAPAALGQTKFQVEKIQLYFQTSSSTPVIGGTIGFPSYYGYIDSSAAATATIPGFAPATVGFDSDSDDYELDNDFPTKAALDAAYPDGNYQISATGYPTLTIPVTGDLYPTTVPQVVGGNWQNNVLVLNAAQSNTITFSNFAGYGSTASGQVAGIIQFRLLSATAEDSVNLKQEYITLPNISTATQSSTPFTSYTIPAGTLTPGLVYEGVLEFIDAGYENVNSLVSGGGVFGMYGSNDEFYIVAQPAAAPAAPVITQQPVSVSGTLGSSVTLTANYTPATTNGANPTTGSWYSKGQLLEAGSKYTFGPNGNVTINGLAATDAGSYSLHVVNASGVVLSNSVSVSIGTPPVITAQPSVISNALSLNSSTGTTAVLSLTATGATTYQWQVNGTNVIQANASGATGPTLVLSAATGLNAGSYVCVVSNASGSVSSNVVVLSFAAAPSPGRLGNLSVLTEDGNGSVPLTVGFEVGGAGVTGQQSLLIRGDGPLLAASPFNLSGTLADPVITLFLQGSSTALASDDNWGTYQSQVTAAEANTFAYPLTVGSLDAALVSSLASGAYSVQVTGNGNPVGQALAEVYDNTPSGTYTLTTPRLINLSCLTQVNASGLLTAGFVVGGTTAKTLLIRASGPALAIAPFNISTAMPDPQLTVHTTVNSQDVVLASNAGWAANPQITAIDSLVYAFALTNPNSHDSAILITLPPGNYTAQVSSSTGLGGTVLAEIYEVP